MTRDRRVALGVIAAGAVVAIVASRDVWFTLGPGFSAPDVTVTWMLDVAAAAVGLCAVVALVRRAAGPEHVAALAGVVVAGALLGLLVAYGDGLDGRERGAWLGAVAAAMIGGAGAHLLMRGGPLGPGARRAVVAATVAFAAAAVLIPPDGTHDEIQVIR